MDLPHAPYLFMMAVGEFSITIDEWNGKLLEYYVEPKYKADAKNIYKNTKPMLTFFSEKLGVPYPWAKYSQVVVRDYVSGAMENTTAVIFGDFVQMTTRELIDRGDLNESIVAHEMMHHWFGDLVTCESWANLPLNESFANYSEYLWFEHKYGRDAADYIRKNEIEGYMNQAVANKDMHPLIYYGYDDKEDMFDAHSYNKGGTILHMLRYYLGDDIFFASLKKYLQDNQYTAAEVHDLRLAFEEVSGEDLNWFFNQWFFTAGHPNLEITKEYDAPSRTIKVTVQQTQDVKKSTVFKLPFAIDVSLNNKTQRHNVIMTKQKQTFSFYVGGEPDWVGVDAERVILGKRKYKQTKEELINQFRLSKRFQNRYEALKELRYNQKGNPDVTLLFEDAMKDPFWAIREMAIDMINIDKADEVLINKMIDIAKNDPRSQVRRAAMERIGGLEDPKYLDVCKNAISTEQSYMVISAALYAISRTDANEGIKYAELLKNTDNVSILLGVANIFEKTKQQKYLSFYKQNWDKTTNYARFSFLGSYANLLKGINDEALIVKEMNNLKQIATSKNTSQWGRYASASAVKKLRDQYFNQSEVQYNAIVEKIKGLKNQNKAAALEALDKMQADKSATNYQNTVKEVKALQGGTVESILNMVDDFNKPTLYDTLNSYIRDIKKWEKDETLAKLYKPW
jgi:aminopeptidase N